MTENNRLNHSDTKKLDHFTIFIIIVFYFGPLQQLELQLNAKLNPLKIKVYLPLHISLECSLVNMISYRQADRQTARQTNSLALYTGVCRFFLSVKFATSLHTWLTGGQIILQNLFWKHFYDTMKNKFYRNMRFKFSFLQMANSVQGNGFGENPLPVTN